MTPKTARLALSLALCALVTVSVAFYAQGRENESLKARLSAIERGDVTPAGMHWHLYKSPSEDLVVMPSRESK